MVLDMRATRRAREDVAIDSFGTYVLSTGGRL